MTEVLTYEALKADRDALAQRADALAVESAELIEGLRCIYTTALIAQDSGPEILYSWDFANQPAEEIEMWISDAKETDAALDAVRAQERADLISVFNQQIKNTGLDDEALVTVLECREALKHAVELREGK
jgi:hypothetical protein